MADEDICVRFGKRLRKIRNRRGWSIEFASDELGISRRYWSDVELGKKEPCLRKIEQLAQGLDVSITELMRGL